MVELVPQTVGVGTDMSLEDVKLSRDLLQGAAAIAEFMFGDQNKRRQVYHLAQNTSLPVFRLGATLCARRSTLLAWIEAQEGKLHG